MADRSGSGGRDDTGPRTRRVVVLLALAVIAALVLAPPLRLYVQQQQDIAALRADISSGEARVAGLQQQLDLWQEDAYVAAQARERLNFVMPGEVGYVVPDQVEDEELSDATDVVGGADGVVRPAAPPAGTWYGRLWSSVEATGVGASDPVLDAPVVGGGG